MLADRHAWVVTNRSSGSNDPASAQTLRAALEPRLWPVDRHLCFPDEGVPSIAELEAAGNPVVVIFTGDGTVNAFAKALEGWSGALLVLPGGTQNLLAKRMHGDAAAEVILDRIARGAARQVRISIIRCEAGLALADLLVGPGASWHSVREALREGDLPKMAGEASEALGETAAGPGVRCIDPVLGAREGYPLIKLMPSHRGIQADAYHADSLGEYLAQGWAMLRRDFRKGPHDRLALADRLVLDKADGSALTVLLDGEPAELGARAEFTLATCNLSLIATAHGY